MIKDPPWTRHAAIKQADERLMSGSDALAWLEPAQGHVVDGRGPTASRTEARRAVDEGWLLVVAPRSPREHAWKHDGEHCYAVQCPACGHRLLPTSRGRRARHRCSPSTEDNSPRRGARTG